MKYFKYSLAALLVVVVAVAVTAHMKREALALSIANAILDKSDFVVTDLAITRLNTHELHFSKLDLAQSDGTRYELRDLQLPLALPDTTISSVSIGKLNYLPPTERAAPGSLTELLDLALNLPTTFPDINVAIGQVLVPDWPVLDELDWQSFEQGQLLSLSVESMDVELETRTLDSAQYSVQVNASRAASEPELSLALQFERRAEGYEAHGPAMLELEPVLALLRELNYLDDAALAMSGRLSGPARLDIETDHAAEVRLLATLARSPDTSITYASGDGLQLQTGGAEVYELAASYPALTWRVTTDALSATAATDSVAAITLQLADLICDSGLQCNMQLDARIPALSIDETRARDVAVNGAFTASFADALQLNLDAAALRAKAVSTAGWSIASVQLDTEQDFRILYGDAGMRATATQLGLQVREFKVGEDLVANLSVALHDFSLAVDELQTKGGFEIAAAGTSLRYAATKFTVPPVRGSFKLAADKNAALGGNINLTLGRSNQSLAAQLDVALLPDRTTIEVGSISLAFDKMPLSKRLERWPYTWDIVAGHATASGRIEISGAAGDGMLTGAIQLSLTDIAGNYDDIAATGISGTAPITLGTANNIQVGPAEIQVKLLDIGLPVENLSAIVAFDSSSELAQIDELDFSVLGGTVKAAPFVYGLEKQSSELELSLSAIQLPLIAQLADFEDIEVSGTVSGTLPVEIEGKSVRVIGGKLASDAPGGVIRYHPGASSTDTSALGLATKALSNLQFESLTSDVTYTRDGDLQLKMRLKGTNPEYDPLQPVILNLGVENNIPQLLRSLQATRDIEDIIETRGSR